mmetsp:Transcript_83625/g.135597  ORF Transcript_83625/g.135597 Transcript_83625/m.135597 type:complete len:397 (+) Transcript_83625:1216-2406(+)
MLMQPTAPRTLALKAGWQANGGKLAPGEAARVLSASVGGGSGIGGHQSPTSVGGKNENETPALSASESGVQDDLQTDNAAVRPFVPMDHEQQEKEDENEMRAVEREVEFPSCDSREKAPVEIVATPLMPAAAAAADAEEQEEQERANATLALKDAAAAQEKQDEQEKTEAEQARKKKEAAEAQEKQAAADTAEKAADEERKTQMHAAAVASAAAAAKRYEESGAAAAENNAAAVLKKIQAASAQAAAAAESNQIMSQVLNNRTEAAAKMTQRMQSATRDRVPSGQAPEAKHHEATHEAMHDGQPPSRGVETPPLRHKHLLKPDPEGGFPGSKDEERDFQYRRHASAFSNVGRGLVFPRRAPPALEQPKERGKGISADIYSRVLNQALDKINHRVHS